MIQELRINNLLKNGIVSQIKENEAYCYKPFKGKNSIANRLNGKWFKLEELAPIPITEKILLDCGFEEDDFDLGAFGIWQDKYEYVYQINEYSLCFGQRIHYSNNIENIKHLHQLQNLFYSLCGKELELDI